MTLNELIAQLNGFVEQGLGNAAITIYDEDEGITKDIQKIEIWERRGKPLTIDINVGR